MFARIMTLSFAVLVAAAPVAAQQRGTMELGAFASSTKFDNTLGMNSSWGAGARIGVFVIPRLSVEFEGSGMNAGRTLGLQNVNVGYLSARLTAVPLKFGRVSVLAGAGVDHTDTYFMESFGVHGLLGAKYALSDMLALRVDGIDSYMANGKYTNLGLHLGLSIYRSPKGLVTTNTVTRTVAAAPMAQRPDSVSAYETRRLRAVAVSYQELRDSLARPPKYVAASSAEALATMKEMIYFQNESSALSDSAKAILRDKVTVFKANPAMRIVITGFASQSGTDTYNFTLGRQRADAAKAYLVSQGVEPVRIEVSTKGSGQLVVDGPGEEADAANRRGQFRLLIADPYLAAPRK